MRRLLAGVFAGIVSAALGIGAVPATAAASTSSTIVGIAVSNPDFSTLVAAVSCTGLVPTLNGNARYTVFAPTNEAFAKLGLNAANVCTALPRSTLKNILLYHVTRGTRLAKNVLPRESDESRVIRTLLEGQSFQVNSAGVITASSGGTSRIVAANIRASNGVIHVIDSVLIPGSNHEPDEADSDS